MNNDPNYNPNLNQQQGYPQGYPQQPTQQGYPQQAQQGYPQQPMQQGYPQQAPQGYPQQPMQQGYPQGAPQGYGQPFYPQPQRTMYPQRKRKVGLVVGIILTAVLLMVVGTVAYMLINKKAKKAKNNEIFTAQGWTEIHGDSYLVPEEDGTFRYYKYKDNLDDYYYEGHYDFYMGDDAYKYVTEDLSQYGVNKSELDTMFAMNEEYDKSNLVCFVLHNEKCIMDGVDTLEGQDAVDTPYYGCLLDDGEEKALDVANMNAIKYYYFVAD